MNALSKAAESIEKCGEEVQIIKGENTYKTMALIQPLKNRYSSYFSGVQAPIGALEDQVYTYIGKPDVAIDILTFDAIVNTKEDSYVVKRSEEFKYKGNIVYIWALLQKHIVED